MLRVLHMENWKSFRDPVDFTMIAGKESRHSNTLFRDGKARILPTAAIYGANAAGKSALLGAVHQLRNLVFDLRARGRRTPPLARPGDRLVRTPYAGEAPALRSPQTLRRGGRPRCSVLRSSSTCPMRPRRGMRSSTTRCPTPPKGSLPNRCTACAPPMRRRCSFAMGRTWSCTATSMATTSCRRWRGPCRGTACCSRRWRTARRTRLVGASLESFNGSNG